MAVSQEASQIIQRKKLQYCRFADTFQWQLLDNIILLDASLSFSHPDGSIINQGGTDLSFSSREEFVEYFSNALKEAQTIHVIGPGEFDQTGPNEMNVVWAVIYHSTPKGADGGSGITGGGHYYETWTRNGDDWFMKSMRMERVY